MGVSGGGQNRGRGGTIFTPTNSFLLLGVLASVLILVKIDQEMPPSECSQTGRQTDTQTQTNFISERELMFTFAICRRLSVCLSSVCLSVVCNVRAPYSGD